MGAGTQGRETSFSPEEKSSFVGSLGSSEIQVSKGSMTVLKAERTVNLYKVIESVVIGDVSVATEKGTTRLWHMRLRHMSERGLQTLHNKGALPDIKYCKLDLYKFCIIRRQRKVGFSTSQYKVKGLLDLIHTNVWGPSPIASIGGCLLYTSPSPRDS